MDDAATQDVPAYSRRAAGLQLASTTLAAAAAFLTSLQLSSPSRSLADTTETPATQSDQHTSIAAAPSTASNVTVVYVSPTGTVPQQLLPPGPAPSPTCYPTITTALEAHAAQTPDTRSSGLNAQLDIRVLGGTYQERLLLQQPGVTIQAWPQGSAVEVRWVTPEPYQSVVDCSAQGVVLQGLMLRHASKSVANNYAVFLHGRTNAVLRQCDVSSTTGSGVGVEGADPSLIDCKVVGCARHGVAVFGPLDPFSEPPGQGTLQGCDVSGNAGCGVLVRSGAEPTVMDCVIHDNKEWGISLQDCGGSYTGNSVRGNAKGAMQVVASWDLDTSGLPTTNSFSGALSLR